MCSVGPDMTLLARPERPPARYVWVDVRVGTEVLSVLREWMAWEIVWKVE